MDPVNERYEAMLADAKELYLKYNGRRHELIEREMRNRGWTFYREMLYINRRSGKRSKGLPEKYGWKELLKHEKPALPTFGRETFPSWLRQEFPEWTWGWRYQRYVYERLGRVTAGKCKRLMIFMPPRHGKSEMVTVRYAAWRLLRDPKLNLILGSYNQRLANRFSRKLQRVFTEGQRAKEIHPQISTDKHRSNKSALIGVHPLSSVHRLSSKAVNPQMDTDKHRSNETAPIGVHPLSSLDGLSSRSPHFKPMQSVSEWETSGGGLVRAVGAGAGIAGFGAGLIIIDDPVRNRADAESETFRDKVWDWFNDDIYTRLEPNAAIILIQTRWHEDDLAGRLLKEQEDGGEKWEVIKLPAIAEAGDAIGRKPGAALCPSRYSLSALERTRKKLGAYSFAALYQQDPVPATGGIFKRAWFKNVVDAAPPNLQWKRGYDLAISTRTSADYTASFRCAYDRDGSLYIADGFRKRMEYPDQRRYIIERMRSEAGTEHCVEAALHGKALVQDLRSDPTLRRFPFKEVRVDADKLTRALAWLNLAEAGKLYLVRGPWIDDFINEVCRFPSAQHDDQVDAVSLAVSMLTASTKFKAFGF